MPDSLTSSLIVGSNPEILVGLAHDWVRLSDEDAKRLGADVDQAYRAETVIQLQEALHAQELARVTQGLSVRIAITPLSGFPAAGDAPVLKDDDAAAATETEMVTPRRHRRPRAAPAEAADAEPHDGSVNGASKD